MKSNHLDGRGLRARRESLGLTPDDLAKALSMGAGAGRDLEDMEAGRRPVPPLMAFAVQALVDGYRPPHLRAGPALALAA